MATLPPQIQRDLDRANAMLTPPQQAEAPPVALTPVAEAVQVQSPASEPVASPAPPEPPREDWQHKYRTLQGIHSREVGDLRQRLGQMEDLVRQLQDRPATPHTPTPVAVDPQDAEVFGADLVEMVRRTAAAAHAASTQTLEQRMAALEQQTAGTTAVVSKTADELFYERLAQMVPDWEDVNKDEGFLAWLAEIDPMYGNPRQAALTSAGQQRDVARVATVFNTYKGIAGASSPKPNGHASRSEPTVSPRTSGTGASREVPAAGGQKPLIAVSDIEAFYKDVQHGKYRGREQEMNAQEAIINAALAENRIVQTMPRH